MTIELTGRESIKDVLIKLKNKVATVTLNCGNTYKGIVASVEPECTIIKELTGKEFFNVVIQTSTIIAVEYRAREA